MEGSGRWLYMGFNSGSAQNILDGVGELLGDLRSRTTFEALLQRKLLLDEDVPRDRLAFVPIAFFCLGSTADHELALALDVLNEPAPVFPQGIAGGDVGPHELLCQP